MGETAIDEETFTEYLTEIREHYTADKVRIFFLVPLSTSLTSSQVPSPRYARMILSTREVERS